jgi:GNAT superfamily N-acetyltransferase
LQHAADRIEHRFPQCQGLRSAAELATLGLVVSNGTTAQLRILLVDPSARGHHVGGRLVDECISFARRAGYERMKLWTNHPLAAARRIYLARGFKLVVEEAHQSFGTELIGQVYELDLRPLLA